ncbi:unnamed protein product [Leptidea sinapis]|uniref:HIT-type domain-containing protein n=1 Tax=Leptidea sinapis TaxID=189913 RepID=A0A5E4PL49_9NEOP|nr:unnamed protein product [Leptidea sinapis]
MTLVSCVCGGLPKYKCPTCEEPYCSVSCCKKHKEKPCSRPQVEAVPKIRDRDNVDYEYPSEDTVPIEKLKLLGQSEDIKKCLENPNVRAILEELDKSTQPDKLISKYMQEPIFTEFVDACLGVVQNQSSND